MKTPYQILSDIEQNSKTYSVSLPHQEFQKRDWRGLSFQASGLQFVSAISEVNEVLPLIPLSPISLLQPWFKGIGNLRGRLLPVTDLQGFVSGKISRASKDNGILVILEEGKIFGFLVETLPCIEPFFAEDLQQLSFQKPELDLYLPYIEGYFLRQDQHWFVLNLHNLLKKPEFYHLMA